MCSPYDYVHLGLVGWWHRDPGDVARRGAYAVGVHGKLESKFQGYDFGLQANGLMP
jgi:hypothetical protein